MLNGFILARNDLHNFMKKISRGMKKYIRRKKAEIRRVEINVVAQKELIKKLHISIYEKK